MRPRTVAPGMLAAIVLMVSGCRKLDAPPPPSKTITLDAIPSDMGELFAVTTSPQWPANAQLWFVKPDKTIAMIGINMKTLRVGGTTVVIPRR
jgi:hypothetical protein